MARAWILDRWTRNAVVDDRGGRQRVSPPSAAMRKLAATRDPFAIDFPDQFKTKEYGRGKRWRVRWFETDSDGRKHWASKSFDKKSDAEAKLAEVSDEQMSGRYINRSDKVRVFGDVAREWLESLHDAKQSTIGNYTTILNRYVLPRWGDSRLLGISETAINQWLSDLRNGTAPCNLADDARHHASGVSYTNQIFRRFHSVIIYALKRGYLSADPARNITVSRIDATREERNKVFLTEDEVRMLADAVAELPDANGGGKTGECAVYLMAYCGLRIGECFGLHVGDIDLDGRRITVRRTLSVDAHGKTFEGSPKNSRIRKVAMQRFLADMLRPFVEGKPLDSYVFHTSSGGPYSTSNWRRRVFNQAKEGAGLGEIDGLRPHSLRHTFASLAIKNGCDVVTLAAAMGHSDIKETLNTYSGLWPDRLDEVADAIEPSWVRGH